MEDKGSKRKWYLLDGRAISNLLVVLIGILFYMALANFGALQSKADKLLSVLSPFIAGFAFAYLLNTPMEFFERNVYHQLRHKRGLSVLTVYLLALVVVVILLNLILPQVIESIMALGSNMSTYLSNLNRFAQEIIDQYHLEGEGLTDLVTLYQNMLKRAAEWASQKVPELLSLGVAVGNVLISAITALISSVYMLAGKGRLVPQLKKIIYAFVPTAKANRFLGICRHANGVFVGFINGKIIDSAIIGVLCFVLNLIFRIPFPMLVAVVVGVTNVIPFFGPIIGAVPCIMILIIVDPWAALRFGVLVIALQQFDGNILGPKILGDSTGLDAIWVLVAIIVGGGLFGFPGMLLGVPTFAVIYALVRDWTNSRLKVKGIDGNGNPVAAASGETEEIQK